MEKKREGGRKPRNDVGNNVGNEYIEVDGWSDNEKDERGKANVFIIAAIICEAEVERI